MSDAPPSPDSTSKTELEIIAATRLWLEKAVIGLGLCPFANHSHLHNRIHYGVSPHQSAPRLLDDLKKALHSLHNADPQQCETSLLIHPYVLNNFDDYNEFLNQADAAVRDVGLEGALQIASFHPDYQFAGSAPDDIENYTNRSPYPMLHILRESSVTHAVNTFGGIDDIVRNNGATLRSLGKKGWENLWAGK